MTTYRSLLIAILFIGGAEAHCTAGITFPEPPDLLKQKALAQAEDLAKWIPHGTLQIIFAYQTYINFKIIETKPGELAVAAEPQRWKYMVSDKLRIVVSIEQNLKGDGMWSTLGNDFIDVIKTVERLRELPQMQGQDYEFRYLRGDPSNNPGDITCVWLHGASDDLIVPRLYKWGPEEWDFDRAYSLREFAPLFKARVERETREWAKRVAKGVAERQKTPPPNLQEISVASLGEAEGGRTLVVHTDFPVAGRASLLGFPNSSVLLDENHAIFIGHLLAVEDASITISPVAGDTKRKLKIPKVHVIKMQIQDR